MLTKKYDIDISKYKLVVQTTAKTMIMQTKNLDIENAFEAIPISVEK